MKRIVTRGLPMLLMFVLIVFMSRGTIFEFLAMATEVPHSVYLYLNPSSVPITVGDSTSLQATITENWYATPDNTVKWSVSGSAVTLYTDANCQSPLTLNTATDTMTVYVRANSVGSAIVTVTSNQESRTSASCTVTVNNPSYTVTYDPGEGTYSGSELPSAEAVKQGDIYIHVIQKYEDKFTAPEGKHFDHWDDGKGHTYKYGDTINPVTENITLTAIWVDNSQDSGTQPQRRGGGLSGDLVFFGGSGADDGWEYIGGGVPQRAYRLSFAPMQGGSAYFLLNSGENGETMNVYPQTTVRVVPTPAPGYRLASIVWSMIDGSASYDITEAQTFVMPAMDAVVYVTFQPIA